MMTKLKGYLEAARKLQLKIGSYPNEISEMTTYKIIGAALLPQSNF